MTPTSSYLMKSIQQTNEMLIRFRLLIEDEFHREHRKEGSVSPTFASLHYHGGNAYETFKTHEFTLDEKGYDKLVKHNYLHQSPIMGCMLIFGLEFQSEKEKSEKILYVFTEDPIYSTIMTWREEVDPENTRYKILVRRPHLISKHRISPNLLRFRTIIDTGLSLKNTRN